MNRFHISGPKNLSGEIKISGSKNAALPILLTSLLISEPIKLKNVPKLTDIMYAIKILTKLGVKIKVEKKVLYIDAKTIAICTIPDYLTKKTRASIWILGPLLARFGQAKISLPGGCKIGKRKIDLHLSGLKKLGANIAIKNNYIIGSVITKLIGNTIVLPIASVGATITIMSAATIATGITIINNAAREPEIIDVANFLNKLGAKIIGAGSKNIFITGVLKLHGGSYTIMPDRIETGTFLVAAAISNGSIICHNTKPNVLINLTKKLCETGAQIKTGTNWISLNMKGIYSKAINIKTAPYPGFPTDMQAIFSLLNLVSHGNSIVTETIFENRFSYVSELKKMGAKAQIKNNSLFCYGVKKLYSATVFASDLRSCASLILAGCIADGTTIVKNIHYIKRGYERFQEKLQSIGAKICN
ncbi:UDP-N-acetylglucosamine 1-carboxyvinyltransferase [Buchnera aphidicola str. Bp (Baizongia pistaciae)]|uniref:UDP-N-acetylglucosamine 1-carboxyvinyltransferase n=1 Tax=Buchnera aphidicola subsp. Baizongia pistaciae (strain Bp) TaxID=224915 RepID=MURA_BUCBP|nr:UDP-N-acetylglucosamine 1-carboxyvinyltransferase [Buchnera aphidicola]Q89AE9.1 RecName: Full=UDP-N-acetylglucosamine 1-carboxyvinyltransferase; AltName: Full=Enoylpyruvate transferase; AltName: Full=UDP-N-acetylglucosamine enolpyruvyl transferase; Short=EPT [Buchnera aphidicola str. Bp (Baizongia pistaciae)]AAO27068.1 UDP-N-acetylglucosamine 1-carboxyvinyltransferase [Buchnera aphidicola str. Bp (Baizongia pistaciae)]